MAAISDITPPILFFDGGCALCHGAVRRLVRWERESHARLRFAPLEGPTADALRLQDQLPEHREAVILWTAQGAFEGEAAVGQALEIIGRPGWGRAFRILPAPLRRTGYRLTARNRQRWFGRVYAGCPMPADPERILP